jgi:hypothetical protein
MIVAPEREPEGARHGGQNSAYGSLRSFDCGLTSYF